MKHNHLLTEMSELLLQSEHKFRQLGQMISTAHNSQAGITEQVHQDAESIKEETRRLSERWHSLYNSIYRESI